jgi:hypothetical protein
MRTPHLRPLLAPLEGVFSIILEGGRGQRLAGRGSATGNKKRDYSKIRVALVSIFSGPCSKHLYGNYKCIKHPPHNPLYEAKPQYRPEDAQETFASLTGFHVARHRQLRCPGVFV